MSFFGQLFVWWKGQTFGTRMTTLFFGKRVGEDAAGNVYYRHRQRESNRWVIYNGIVDASKVPPDWHAWLHNMTRAIPRDDREGDLDWFKTHRANLTGTEQSYLRPAVSMLKAKGLVEYEPWQPSGTNPKN